MRKKLENKRRHLEGLMRCVKMSGKYEYLGDGKGWEARIREINQILSETEDS